MSSKFGGPVKVQKPPAVCKHPPPRDLAPPPPFRDRQFQGYCEWSDPVQTDPTAVTGVFPMTPTFIPYVWDGNTEEVPVTAATSQGRRTDVVMI